MSTNCRPADGQWSSQQHGALARLTGNFVHQPYGYLAAWHSALQWSFWHGYMPIAMSQDPAMQTAGMRTATIRAATIANFISSAFGGFAGNTVFSHAIYWQLSRSFLDAEPSNIAPARYFQRCNVRNMTVLRRTSTNRPTVSKSFIQNSCISYSGTNERCIARSFLLTNKQLFDVSTKLRKGLAYGQLM